MDAVIPRSVNLEIAGSLLTVSTGLLDGAKLRLSSTNVTPTGLTKLADLTELTMDGYTPGGIAITWGTPYYDTTGNVRIPAPSKEVIAGNSIAGPVTAYVAYVVGDPSGSAFLAAAWKFDSALSWSEPKDGQIIEINIPL